MVTQLELAVMVTTVTATTMATDMVMAMADMQKKTNSRAGVEYDEKGKAETIPEVQGLS